MGIKRRAFLIGGAAVVGGGIFAIGWADNAAMKRAAKMTAGPGEFSFATWLKIGEDDVITIYSPHIDFGQGSHTALGQMAADELDADWAKIRVEQAPAETAFANTPLGKEFLAEMSGFPGLVNAVPNALISMLARAMPLQITGGSTAIRMTGQHGIRVVAAAARSAMLTVAGKRLNVPPADLTVENGVISHPASGRSLRYGEVAGEAAGLALDPSPKLKERKDYKYIGKPVRRFDIPAKVNGTARYGMDFTLPDMRVATVMMAPVRGGKLQSVNDAPALAVPGVEKVFKLDEAVVVVARGYWAALKGLRSLSPEFSDGGYGQLSSESIYQAHERLIAKGKYDKEHGDGDVDAALEKAGDGTVTGDYQVPFLHQAMMEPFALSAHFKNGKLDLWGGLQDPLSTKMLAAKAAGLDAENVTFHPMIMGGGFGRRFPDYCQIIEQVAKIAVQLPHPVKLIWSREEEVQHGAYRPQSSARLTGAVGADGKISAWRNDYAQFANAEAECVFPYVIPATARRHYEYISNQVDAYWRSVNSTQHGFYNESFMDELAHAAGADPYEFRRKHLPAGSRYLKVLDAVAERAGWGGDLPEGVGRGIALVQSFNTIVAEVVEASVNEDGSANVHKVYAVVDCGTTVNPLNAEAQIQGGIIMGLSAALGEEITLQNGAVVQSNFHDYPILKMAGAPEIDVHFIESDAPMGGIGEPGVPPSAPALANAIFAVTGTRIRKLPIGNQAVVAPAESTVEA